MPPPHRSLSFSLYVDFLLARGTARYTAALEQNKVPFDVYRAFKAMVSAIAEGKASPDRLVELQAKLRTDRTRELYRGLVAGFLGFMGSTPGAVPFLPSSCGWAVARGLELNVNPEMGLVIAGVPHTIKLYCRVEPLEKARIEMMGGVMVAAMGTPHEERVAVLDVRQAKLHAMAPAKLARAVTVARAEAQSFAQMIAAAA